MSTSTVPIDLADVAAARALRVEFGRFWSTAEGEPRDVYDRFIGATPVADGVSVEPCDRPPGVWTRPPDPVSNVAMLFLHGGGYVQGSTAAYTGFVSQLAVRARMATFALEYPLAPESPFPAAFDAAVATLTRLGDDYDAVVVAGDSAGGGLTLATVAQASRAGVNVAAAAVFSPFADLTLSGDSMQRFAVGDPLLDPAFIAGCASAYRGSTPASDPRVSPVFDHKDGMPPLLIQVGSDELLLDDSLRYADGVEKAGGRVQLEVWQGMHHVFQLNVVELASARAALDTAGAFLRTHVAAAASPRW